MIEAEDDADTRHFAGIEVLGGLLALCTLS